MPLMLLNQADVRRLLDPATMLDVRQADGTGDLFPLHLLMRVTYTQDRFVSLTFPDCIVTLEGQNLSELKRALHARRVDFVQVFNSEALARPSGEPVISGIQINAPFGSARS